MKKRRVHLSDNFNHLQLVAGEGSNRHAHQRSIACETGMAVVVVVTTYSLLLAREGFNRHAHQQGIALGRAWHS